MAMQFVPLEILTSLFDRWFISIADQTFITLFSLHLFFQVSKLSEFIDYDSRTQVRNHDLEKSPVDWIRK